ncbi:hypothetical protein BH11ACT2_BH11ACT2_21770 [soil metagenome]
MSDETGSAHDSVGGWAKSYYYASRTVIESVLREHDLGQTQWYVLYQLAHDGPTIQRDLGRILKIERATLSGIVSTLVRKGLIEQVADAADQRQRVLRLSPAGEQLWKELPDPVAISQGVAFEGADAAELDVARRVLRTATQRLQDHLAAGGIE